MLPSDDGSFYYAEKITILNLKIKRKEIKILTYQ